MREYGGDSDNPICTVSIADFVVWRSTDDVILQRDNSLDILESIRLTFQALTVRRFACGHSYSASNKSVRHSSAGELYVSR